MVLSSSARRPSKPEAIGSAKNECGRLQSSVAFHCQQVLFAEFLCPPPLPCSPPGKQYLHSACAHLQQYGAPACSCRDRETISIWALKDFKGVKVIRALRLLKLMRIFRTSKMPLVLATLSVGVALSRVRPYRDSISTPYSTRLHLLSMWQLPSLNLQSMWCTEDTQTRDCPLHPLPADGAHQVPAGVPRTL